MEEKQQGKDTRQVSLPGYDVKNTLGITQRRTGWDERPNKEAKNLFLSVQSTMQPWRLPCSLSDFDYREKKLCLHQSLQGWRCMGISKCMPRELSSLLLFLNLYVGFQLLVDFKVLLLVINHSIISSKNKSELEAFKASRALWETISWQNRSPNQTG